MRRGVKVLVVMADCAFRASLGYLLGLEPDLEVFDCSPREAEATLARVKPDVVITSGAYHPVNCRVVPLTAMVPYDTLLRELHTAG